MFQKALFVYCLWTGLKPMTRTEWLDRFGAEQHLTPLSPTPTPLSSLSLCLCCCVGGREAAFSLSSLGSRFSHPPRGAGFCGTMSSFP